MEQVLKEGGSVHVPAAGGASFRLVSRVEDLPSEADLAGDDDVARAQAKANLERQIQDLMAQRMKLEPTRADADAEKARLAREADAGKHDKAESKDRTGK
jgi:uncharacterized membrane protein YukC